MGINVITSTGLPPRTLAIIYRHCFEVLAVHAGECVLMHSHKITQMDVDLLLDTDTT